MFHHHEEECKGCPLTAVKGQRPQMKTRLLKGAQNRHRKKHVCKVKSQYLFFVMSFNLNSVMLRC